MWNMSVHWCVVCVCIHRHTYIYIHACIHRTYVRAYVHISTLSFASHGLFCLFAATAEVIEPPTQILMGDLKMLVGNIGQLDGVDPEKPLCRMFLLLPSWSCISREESTDINRVSLEMDRYVMCAFAYFFRCWVIHWNIMKHSVLLPILIGRDGERPWVCLRLGPPMAKGLGDLDELLKSMPSSVDLADSFLSVLTAWLLGCQELST